MDKTLEAKLKDLTAYGKKIEAIQDSISQKQALVDNLKANALTLKGLPAVVTLSQQTVNALEQEIEEEKNEVDKLKANL